jgi:two-component system response regulator QseB
MRVLLVDDDPMIGASVREGLGKDKFAIDWVENSIVAAWALEGQTYQLMLLDLELPAGSGLDLLTTLRRRGNAIPVVILTSHNGADDRIAGLDCGADDFLLKPFNFDELTARVQAVIRRHEKRTTNVIVLGDLSLNPQTHQAVYHGRTVSLSAHEFCILQALIEWPGVVFSKAQLAEHLYGVDKKMESNAVEVHIHHLRSKLSRKAILNLRGIGYVLAEEP